jgi:hypothetical protein
MKAIKIGLISLISILVLAIGALIAIPYLFKDKIIALVKEEANKSIIAKLNFDNDVNISLLRSFPRLSIELNHLSIEGLDSFAQDTLIYTKNLSVIANAWEFYKNNEIEIYRIHLEEPKIKFKVLKSGKSNWDITKPDDDSNDSSSIAGQLESFTINKGILVYDDAELGFFTSLNEVNHSSSGDFNSDVFDLITHTDAKNVNVQYENMPLLAGADVQGDATLHIDIAKSIYQFKENEFTINDLPLTFDALFSFDLYDNVFMDVKLNAPKSKVKNFLSLIPALYNNSYKDLKAEGNLALSGYMKGLYSDKTFPAYGLIAKIEKGNFKYPTMPLPMDNIALDLKIDNPDGIDDHTVIHVHHLNFNLANDPMFIKLKATNPVTDMLIDAEMKGILNLSNFTKLIPFEQKTTLSGTLASDILLKVSQSAFEKQDVNNFEASGIITADHLQYQTPDMPELLNVNQAHIKFSTLFVEITDFVGNFGKNDLDVKARFDNFFGYALGKQTLKGKLNINSKYFNVNDFISEPTNTEQRNTTNEMTVVEIPGNIDLIVNSHFDAFNYDTYKLKNFTGKTELRDQILQINQLNTDMFGGVVALKGNYNAKNISNPLVDMEFSLQEIDIPKIFESISTIKILAPIAAFAKGKISSKFNLKTLLDAKMSPVLNNISCKGLLDLINVNVEGSQSLNNLAYQLNNSSLSKLNIQNKLLHFKIEDGKLFVEPFDIALGDAKLKLEGFTAIDQTINYVGILSLPKEMLGNQQNFYDNFQKNSKFYTLNLTPNDVLDIGVNISGMFKTPLIKLMLQEVKQRIQSQIKDAVKSEIDKQKAAVEERAREKLEKAKLQLENSLKQAEDQAKKASEAEKKRLLNEAERIKQEQKNKLEEEAKKKIKDALKKPPF